MLQHAPSASDLAGDHAFLALGYLSDTAEFVETARATSCVRDGGERLTTKIGTAPTRYQKLAALNG